MAVISQGLLQGKPINRTKAIPVKGCTITAGVVNSQSARTVKRATDAMADKLPPRHVHHMKNAVPKPVPNSKVDEAICSN